MRRNQRLAHKLLAVAHGYCKNILIFPTQLHKRVWRWHQSWTSEFAGQDGISIGLLEVYRSLACYNLACYNVHAPADKGAPSATSGADIEVLMMSLDLVVSMEVAERIVEDALLGD